MEQKKTASNKILWIFAIGQLGWSTLSQINTSWLTYFYQPSAEVLERGQEQFIPQEPLLGLITIIGLIMAIGRVFDAVTDPLIAGKSDSLKHKLGRRIPFMRAAAVPFALMTFLMFWSPFPAGSIGNVIMLFVTNILFFFCMTCYCTPYNALIPELGRSPETRINLSTFISVTFFIGGGLAYMVPNIADLFVDAVGYAWSRRITIGILAVFAMICMLIPAFLIDENEYADTTPSHESAMGSLVATFKNKEFRTFVLSDIFYWVGLTIFQTGLTYYITVLIGLDEDVSGKLYIAMLVISLIFYAPVNIFSKKWGKKKLITFAFLFFALTFLFTGFAGMLPIPPIVCGGAIAVLAAIPMAVLGILPQAVVADISDADKADTGESRSGMFYAARTFAMKLGQAIASLIFTRLALIGSGAGAENYGIGYRISAFTAAALCLTGGIVFMLYNEKKVMKRIMAETGSKEENQE